MISNEKSFNKIQALMDQQLNTLADTDPDLHKIINNFIVNDIYQDSILDDKVQQLITLVVLSANQNLTHIRSHVSAALNLGVSAIEIKEAIYQCAPYIGIPKTLDALHLINEEFLSENIQLPLKSQKTVNEDDRLTKGIAVQTEIFGELIPRMRANAPEDQKQIQDYLSAYCFGDFYTRNGLDLKTRELITLSIVSSIGGAEGQVKAHIQANRNVGNEKALILAVITHCLPYIGFPRTLNALACVNEIMKED